MKMEAYIDPGGKDVMPTTCGKDIPTLERLLAHELGHFTGLGDDGPDKMANVRRW